MCYAFGIVASLDLPKSPIEWVPPQASRTYALSPSGACHYPPGETRTVRHPPGADTSAGASERPPSRAAHGPFIEAQRRPLTEEGPNPTLTLLANHKSFFFSILRCGQR